MTAANIAVLLLVAGCGVAADFAAPTATPICEEPGCPTGTPAPMPAATIAAPPHGPPDETTPPGAATPLSSPVAFASAGAALGPVIWTSEIDPETRAPRHRATSLTTDVRAIYATVAVARVRAGTEFGAEWSYNRTRLEAFDATIVADSVGEHLWIEFHLALTRPDVWPNGTYEIAISVNGQPAVTGEIEVVYPET